MKTLKIVLRTFALLLFVHASFAMGTDDKIKTAFLIIVDMQKSRHLDSTPLSGDFYFANIGLKVLVHEMLEGPALVLRDQDNHFLGNLCFDSNVLKLTANDDLLNVTVASDRFYEDISFLIIKSDRALDEKQSTLLEGIIKRLFDNIKAQRKAKVELLLEEPYIFDTFPDEIKIALNPYVKKYTAKIFAN